MRACNSEIQTLKAIEIDEPGKPAAGEALVRTHCISLRNRYKLLSGKISILRLPAYRGHELGVEVLEVGEGVENVSGDRCSVEPYMNCDDCFSCRHGAYNCCQNLKVIGVMMDGGLCESFLVRADKLHPSKQLTYDQLALVETLAIGCHANDRGAPGSGDHALIIGMGPIGLATLEFARLTDATISVMDMNEARLDFVRECESKTRFCSKVWHRKRADGQLTDGDMYRVITDATGNKHSMSNALSYISPTGRLVYVGITTEEVAFRHPVMHRPESFDPRIP